jgi:predicted dehydrogenase
MTIRVGLIGLGGIHEAHVEGYQRRPDARIAGVCDTDADLAWHKARLYGAQAFTDYRELLASPDIDVVDIMLPHSIHEVVASAALQQGKHVLVEKPLAPSSAAITRLRELAQATGRTLAVAENTPFVSAYRAIAEALRDDLIGSPQVVRTLICGSEVRRMANGGTWKSRRDGSGGGVIMDAGVHSLYLLRWLFGPVKRLRAHAERRIEASEVEDFAVITGRLATGIDFVAELTFTAEIPWNERLEIYGSGGSIIADQLTRPVVQHYRNKDDYPGSQLADVAFEPQNWKRNSIVSEIADFIDALQNARPPEVRLDHILDSMQAVEAAYTSLNKAGALVTLT